MCGLVFFFRQKTAYEMRISDWSSDVCSSDLTGGAAYVAEIVPLSNPFGREDDNFRQGWTSFYWAWWISWSPFVGMFIARVSRGRTLREFIVCVVLVPTVVSIFWLAVFGGTGVQQVIAAPHAARTSSPLVRQHFRLEKIRVGYEGGRTCR